MSEDRIQQLSYQWFHNNYPMYRGLLFHVPNGGSRNAREGAKFKTMGVRPGVADFLFMLQGVTYNIELKTLTGKQSKHQLDWQRLVEQQGFKYFVVRSLSEFQELIKTIITNKG
jgi:elongation factor P hydroxylase